MKYLIVIALLLGAYWVYTNHHSTGASPQSISEKIESNGFVKAGEVLYKSRDLVNFVCSDDAVLKSWGSSSAACFNRVSNFQELCETRIFPNLDKAITTSQEAKGLISRYNRCLIPG